MPKPNVTKLITSIMIKGIRVSFKNLAKSTIVRPPKIAGSTYGDTGASRLTISVFYRESGISPIMIISVVTIELVAIATVVTISCSSLPCFVLATV